VLELGAGTGGVYLPSLVLVARECLERNLRDDGGPGDDTGAAFHLVVDRISGPSATRQRLRPGHFREDNIVHNGGNHAGLDRCHAPDASGAWRHTRQVLPESAPTKSLDGNP